MPFDPPALLDASPFATFLGGVAKGSAGSLTRASSNCYSTHSGHEMPQEVTR